ncbi:hypothetical protein [Paenibacillus sp. NRS-1760]|uniref:hypothetical protein n=1 Tax=Paenibacillus sp. NRS-1760 TaxID=3233902 RepID=UPI003D2DDC84
MKPSKRWVLIIVIMLWLAVGCENSVQQANEPKPILPILDQIQSVTVTSINGLSEGLSLLEQQADIALLLQGLMDAHPSYIDDPEPSGLMYEVEMKSDKQAQTYTVNDLRTTDSLDTGVKIYTKDNDGQSHAWTLPSEWIRLLLGINAVDLEEPILSISANEDSSSVIVLSNRNMKRETVRDAIANTLAFSGMAANEQPKYDIYWSDSQRFVVRFTNLTAKSAVQFQLDAVQAETGESFVNKTQKNRNHATLKGR